MLDERSWVKGRKVLEEEDDLERTVAWTVKESSVNWHSPSTSDIYSLIINSKLLHRCQECFLFFVAVMFVSSTPILPSQNNSTNVIIDNIYLFVPGYIYMLSINLSWTIQGRLSFPLFTDKIKEVKKFTKITELTGGIVGFKSSQFQIQSVWTQPVILSTMYSSCLSSGSDKTFLILPSSPHLCSIAAAQDPPKSETPNPICAMPEPHHFPLICTVQYSSHQLRATTEPLKCGHSSLSCALNVKYRFWSLSMDQRM